MLYRSVCCAFQLFLPSSAREIAILLEKPEAQCDQRNRGHGHDDAEQDGQAASAGQPTRWIPHIGVIFADEPTPSVEIWSSVCRETVCANERNDAQEWNSTCSGMRVPQVSNEFAEELAVAEKPVLSTTTIEIAQEIVEKLTK